MEEKEILSLFKETGALLSGHFRLSSGLHSGNYFQCALLLQNPDIAEKMCKQLSGYFKDDKPTCVVAPALGGVIVSYETARALGVKSLFTERVEGKVVLRRGFELGKGDRVLVVEDVITTGLSTGEVLEAVKSLGAKIVGVGCIVNRSGKELDFGVKLKNLVKLDFPTYKSEECPLCKKGIEIKKPGSR
ncbi:MAG: orotate phosphoribosyltransferase [Candidatus Omnitrophica bacterium CG22_combo_CG10-13_8_21_14_all_43_16]|nr:MAG: orotate phosphoribosyltransferase [Candidatus Omnitrophica bacterium CG22_combo_CG10-13_8_21_14_all_43_16]